MNPTDKLVVPEETVEEPTEPVEPVVDTPEETPAEPKPAVTVSVE